jgi:tRNA pseudouridine32 synthase/23S rRNA pseudouridine746 synthase
MGATILYKRAFDYAPAPGLPTVLHEDDSFLAFDKPSGLLSVPGNHSEDSLQTRVEAAYPEALLIHRLDMATSGVMIFPRNAEARRHIARQFQDRHIKKRYTALVWGEVTDSGTIELPLRCDWPNRPLQMVDYEQGKPATTHWEAIESGPTSRLALTPITGRSHQLRVHCRELGHPILGDRLYAPDEAYQAAPRLMLHAQSLTLRHPIGGAPITVEASCPF